MKKLLIGFLFFLPENKTRMNDQDQSSGQDGNRHQDESLVGKENTHESNHPGLVEAKILANLHAPCHRIDQNKICYTQKSILPLSCRCQYKEKVFLKKYCFYERGTTLLKFDNKHREILKSIAYQAMLARGLLPDFSSAILSEIEKINSPEISNGKQIRDLRGLLWSSIDNDDSLDLDQLTVAEKMAGDEIKILVALADVDSLVKIRSAIDEHARHNTTSVYTAAMIFPMLPEKLSTFLTSLAYNEDRLSIVVEMLINADGSLQKTEIYPALVRNHAKLAYNSVGAWLEKGGPIPEAIAAVEGLEENLRLQDRVAQKMKDLRHHHGALSLETIETKPVFDGDQIYELKVEEKNRAKELIEDFMITANGAVTRYLKTHDSPCIRRVVRTPKRWDRIVQIAAEYGFTLPDEPDSIALEEFLKKEKAADPLRFPDLSLIVIKLLGAGEYIADLPGDPPIGHFGLAVTDYTHSTAPNRRYADLITHRLLKAIFQNNASPYSNDELDIIARHCTEAEDAANKVERQVNKSAAALFLVSRIGERFEAIITGASAKGTWVRLLNIPVEGKLVQGFQNMDVGHRIQVQLTFVDVERGFIDFKKI